MITENCYHVHRRKEGAEEVSFPSRASKDNLKSSVSQKSKEVVLNTGE